MIINNIIILKILNIIVKKFFCLIFFLIYIYKYNNYLEANPFYPLNNDEIMEVVNETIASIMSSFVGIFENQVEVSH